MYNVCREYNYPLLCGLYNHCRISYGGFISVHDKALLEDATFNASSLDCKLQINSYRKQLDGNIGDDNEYTVVEYDIESARTYVQRLNYSKVNEFQYLLSDNEETAISARIPLSLNNITVKYKIGTQVR